MQKHLIIMDPLEKLNRKLDSSLRMAAELTRLGDEVYYTVPEDMSWDSRQSHPATVATRLLFEDFRAETAFAGQSSRAGLETFTAIHMRKEPPFDMSYIGITWLMDAVSDRCKLFNAPAVLRAFNEKLGILQFKDAIAPALLSCQFTEALSFIDQVCRGDAIVKPLDLYGGKGIFRFQTKENPDSETMLKSALSDGVRLIQPFDPRVYEGEVRVFTLGGEPISWCLKKPADRSFLANTGAGASLHEFQPDPAMEAKVRNIATALWEQGVAITGMDIIGEHISEINITSPRLLQADTDTKNYYQVIATWFHDQCLKT